LLALSDVYQPALHTANISRRVATSYTEGCIHTADVPARLAEVGVAAARALRIEHVGVDVLPARNHSAQAGPATSPAARPEN
jgi:hypothetical protein